MCWGLLLSSSSSFFFQALLQKRNMSVIITWLSSPLHQTETWEDGDFFHPFCHLTSSRPVLKLQHIHCWRCWRAKAVIMEDPSILNSCSMKISLNYSWLNKSLALPLGCDVGPVHFYGRYVLWVSSFDLWVGPASPGWTAFGNGNFQGAILSLYVLPNCKFLNFLYSLWGIFFAYCHLRCSWGSRLVFQMHSVIQPCFLQL